MTALRARSKSGKASLIGGIAVGVASLTIWIAVTRDLGWGGPLTLAAGLVVSAAVATWIRVADL